jgi:hypothetical protein
MGVEKTEGQLCGGSMWHWLFCELWHIKRISTAGTYPKRIDHISFSGGRCSNLLIYFGLENTPVRFL